MTVTHRDDMLVKHIDTHGSDAKIAHAARVSTKGLNNQQGKIEGLVKALWRDGHYSPFEHCHITIAFEVPLFVRDQIVRHKSMSFSVLSGRYTEMMPEFWWPEVGRPCQQVGKPLNYERVYDPEAWNRAVEGTGTAASVAWAEYQRLIEGGVCNEVARAVLPASTYTRMWVTGSLRSWLHFLDQRADVHAQHEIRQVANSVAEIVAQEFPIAFEAWYVSR